MTKLYIMCGLAFSGKSTLARKIVEQTGYKLIAFDKLWVETEKVRAVPQGSEGWRLIRDLAQEKILNDLKSGFSVIYDDNNPKKDHREELRIVARKAGVESFVTYLDTPLDLIRTREEANRKTQDRHEVDPLNFEKVLKDLEPPTSDENVLIFRPGDDVEEFIEKLGQDHPSTIKQKITRFLEAHPRFKKTVGVLLVIIGILSIITPFTPVGFLLVVGLELLGIRYLVWDKIKKWLRIKDPSETP